MVNFFSFELPNPVHVLGLMSGTSGDGIDGALVAFDKNGDWKLLWTDSFSFSAEVRKKILSLMESCSGKEMALARTFIGMLYAEAVTAFRTRNKETIHLLAPHGQTLLHLPEGEVWCEKKLRTSFQALDPSVLAEYTGIPVVSDFRVRDIAVNGQGAPLVPFGDLRYFSKIGEDVGILNIGGIANITVIRHTPVPHVESAFDTGPGNMLLDGVISYETNGRLTFDEDGKLAANGKSIPKLLELLLSDPYFTLLPPKSTGRELFGKTYLDKINRWRQENQQYSTEDILSTILDLTVISIVEALRKFVFPNGNLKRVIVAGGGAKNSELCKRLSNLLAPTTLVEKSDAYGVPTQFREAMAFAALGEAFLRGVPGNIPSATGARKAVILGSLTP